MKKKKKKICKLNFLSVPVRTNCCLYLTYSQVNSCGGGAPCWTSIRAEWNYPNGEMCSSVRVRTLRANETTCWRSQTSKIHQRKMKPAEPTSQSRGNQLTAAEGFVFVKHTKKPRALHWWVQNLNTPKTRLQQISDQNKWQTSPISWSSASRRPRE